MPSTKLEAALLDRVKCEFLEMPGVRLTEMQARRMWGLDAPSCKALMDALIATRFLFRTREGAFMRIERANEDRPAGHMPSQAVA